MRTDTRTLDECLRDRAVSIPETPLLAYQDLLTAKYVDYSARTLNQIVNRAALYYRDILPRGNETGGMKLTIGMLGVSSFEYIITFLALQRLGLSSLLLSTRLADNAFEHLLETCECDQVIVQPAFKPAMSRVKVKRPSLQMSDFIPSSRLAILNGVKMEEIPFESSIDPAKEVGKLSHVIHSSGSTGLPKAVPVKHGSSIIRSRVQFDPKDYGFTCLPLFHNYGLFTLNFAIQSGIKAVFPSGERPLTGSSLVEGLEATNAKMLYCVPYTLKMLTEAKGGLNVLKSLKQVTLSGSSCPEDLGDMVVRSGVKVMNYYGTTETGNLMHRSADEWNWLQLFPMVKETIGFEQRGGGDSDLYECVALPKHRLNGPANREDGSYATKDLFQKHPTDPTKWKYVGRLDDTIVLSNGEKMNPTAMENQVRLNPYVSEAVVFGAERPSLGLMVIASEQAFQDRLSEKDIIESITNDVELGNQESPAYARISNDAIIVKKYGTTWPRTDKGNVIRAAFIQKFENEIRYFYDEQERSVARSLEPLVSGRKAIEQAVREVVAAELKLEDPSAIDGSADFFSLGCDSLGAINIRRRLTRRIDTRAARLPNGLVFENPTLDAIVDHLVRLNGGQDQATRRPEHDLLVLLEKYSTFEAKPDKSILLTGATGSLGSHILHQLVKRSDVDRVYCLVRASSQEVARARVTAALAKACLLLELGQTQLSKIIALPCDLARSDLGLEPSMDKVMKQNVTSVIHSAWFVNFNMDVKSFEEGHIKGTHNLLSFCLASGRKVLPNLNFISSISAAFGFESPKPIPEALPPLQEGVGVPIMGYGRSKLVGEHICGICSRKTGLKTRILRVGQIIGDIRSGVWSTLEAWPLTMRSALSIGALPSAGQHGEKGDEDEICRWLPVDITASTVIDLSLQDETEASSEEGQLGRNGNSDHRSRELEVYNIQHPIPLLWKKDVVPALRKAGLVFDLIPVQEWLSKVESNEDAVANSTIRLADFFRNKYERRRDGEPVTGSEYRIDWTESDQYNALARSKALREAAPVSEELLVRIVQYLMGVWGSENQVK